MRLRKSLAVCAVLLLCAGVAEASFFFDVLRGVAISLAEERDIQRAPDCTLSADDALARSIELLSDGRQAEAEDLIKSAVKTHRSDVRILFAKGVLERSRWSKGAANVWFAMAWQAKGNETISRAAWLSVLLDMQDSIEENLAELILLSDKNPDNIFLLWLGAIHCREQSKASLQLTSTGREIAEMGKKRYEVLLKHFELGPVMLHHTYANILTENLGQNEAALDHRILAVSMEAKSWTLEGFADTLTNLEKYRWACVVWEQAVEKMPSSHCYGRWGDALFTLEKYDEAAEKYIKAFLLSPYVGHYSMKLKQCWEKLGKNQESLTSVLKQAEKEGYKMPRYIPAPTSPEQIAFKQELKQRWGETFEKRIEFMKANPESVEGLVKLGDCYRLGIGTEEDARQAAEYYEKALKLNPGNWRVLDSLARCYFSRKEGEFTDCQKAIRLAQSSVAIEGNKTNLRTLASMYYRNEQYGKAVEIQERVIGFWRKNHPTKEVSSQVVRTLEKYKTQHKIELEKTKKEMP